MGKLKRLYRSVPLRLALAATIAAALFLGSVTARNMSMAARTRSLEIMGRHMTFTEVGESDDNVTYRINVNYHFDQYTHAEMMAYRFYNFAAEWSPAICYTVFVVLAVSLFYVTKLKKPLEMLNNASARISRCELDFTVDYGGTDEMGRLCGAFERMRSALDENNRRMLRMLDEQHQLNDAYTHDLRTPIAILKGYTDMLAKYLPDGKIGREEVIDTVRTMSNHVSRLEQFVNSMNTAQRLTDLTVKRQEVPAEELFAGIRETARLLCGERELECRVETSGEGLTVSVDPAAVTQVFENLLGNALRFASSAVTVELTAEERALTLRVSDDGRGFTGRELVSAAKPYYSGRREDGTYHFGLGLHICRTLCEKHGGSLRLENAPEGGACVTAIFTI